MREEINEIKNRKATEKNQRKKELISWKGQQSWQTSNKISKQKIENKHKLPIIGIELDITAGPTNIKKLWCHMLNNSAYKIKLNRLFLEKTNYHLSLNK